MPKSKKTTGASQAADTTGLTDDHKAALTAAGVDWQKFLAKVKNAVPYLIAIATIFLNDTPPVMQAAKEGCSHKESLECALHQSVCLSHTLCAAICNCDDGGDSEPTAE